MYVRKVTGATCISTIIHVWLPSFPLLISVITDTIFVFIIVESPSFSLLTYWMNEPNPRKNGRKFLNSQGIAQSVSSLIRMIEFYEVAATADSWYLCESSLNHAWIWLTSICLCVRFGSLAYQHLHHRRVTIKSSRVKWCDTWNRKMRYIFIPFPEGK